MIQKTLWSPDTCDPTGENKFSCQIEYQWYDTVPQDQRTHTVSEIIKVCPIHAHHLTKEAHYQDVLDENRSKNKAIGLLVKKIPKLEAYLAQEEQEEIVLRTMDDGSVFSYKRKKPNEQVKWRFEADRSIVLSHSLLTQVDKETMNALPKLDIIKKVKVE